MILCILFAGNLRGLKSMVELENRMLVDSEWGEIEYGIPSKERLKRQRLDYEEIEMEDRENEHIV